MLLRQSQQRWLASACTWLCTAHPQDIMEGLLAWSAPQPASCLLTLACHLHAVVPFTCTWVAGLPDSLRAHASLANEEDALSACVRQAEHGYGHACCHRYQRGQQEGPLQPAISQCLH